MHGDKLQSKCLANYNKTRMKDYKIYLYNLYFLSYKFVILILIIKILKSNIEGKPMIYTSVSDPFYFDTDPDPR